MSLLYVLYMYSDYRVVVEIYSPRPHESMFYPPHAITHYVLPFTGTNIKVQYDDNTSKYKYCILYSKIVDVNVVY